ncbi:MAG: hypothetical protein V1833_05780 [Elusimicrobiota bacterium]
MVTSFLSGLAEEKVVLLEHSMISKLPFQLEGVVRFVNEKGKTMGILLDKNILDEIEEEMQSSNPEFLASLEKSRKSGKVSGKEVKRKLGLL